MADLELEQDAAEPAPQEQEQLVVDVSDDDDNPMDAQPETPEQNRKSRRQERQALKAALKERDDSIGEMRRQLAELQGRVSAPQQQYVAPQQQFDPIAYQMNETVQTQDLILKALQSRDLSQDQVNQYQQRWRDLDNRRIALAVQRATPPPRQQQQQPAVEVQMLMAEFPEVFNDEVLKLRAQAEFAHLTKMGKPANIVTAREAASRVRGVTSPRAAAPSAGQMSKHTSVSGRAGAGGQQGGSFTPSKLQLNSARGYCNTEARRDLPDSEKVKIWYREVGKKESVA